MRVTNNWTQREIDKLVSLVLTNAPEQAYADNFPQRTLDAVIQTRTLYKRYLNRKPIKNRKNLLEKFQAAQVVESPKNGHAPAEENLNLTNLAAIQEAYNEGLATFIDAEVDRRSGEKIAQLKEHYERELQRLQEVLVDAQNSSVVGLLRKKWGNPS